MIAWYNHHFIQEYDIIISPDDRGFTIADGVFDTLLIQGKRAKFCVSHFKRLINHAASIGIHAKLTYSDFVGAARQLIHQNKLEDQPYVLRTQITRGPGPRGLYVPGDVHPTILMRVFMAPESLPLQLRLTCLEGYKNETAPSSRIKSLNYIDHQIALMKAKSQGYDDAVLINTKDKVCCTTSGNIFACFGTKWITPPLEDGVLDGVMRKLFIRKHNAVQTSLTKSDLEKADQLVVTNSVRGWQNALLIA